MSIFHRPSNDVVKIVVKCTVVSPISDMIKNPITHVENTEIQKLRFRNYQRRIGK